MTLGVKLCSRAYCWMTARRSAEMRGESFKARETVATEIPNSRAMSFIVNGVFSFVCKVREKFCTMEQYLIYLLINVDANVCIASVMNFYEKKYERIKTIPIFALDLNQYAEIFENLLSYTNFKI